MSQFTEVRRTKATVRRLSQAANLSAASLRRAPFLVLLPERHEFMRLRWAAKAFDGAFEG
jgi:hypothetical protein